MAELRVGDEVEVEVTQVTNYGVFVRSGECEGLILLPELSWERLRHPSDVAQVGDCLRCKIIHMPATHPFMASLRAMRPDLDPWGDHWGIRVGQVFRGEVTNDVPYGVFARYPSGADALIHNDHMDMALPRSGVGQRLDLRIVALQPERRKMLVCPATLEPGGLSRAPFLGFDDSCLILELRRKRENGC